MGWLIKKVLEMLKMYKKIFTNVKYLRLIMISGVVFVIVVNVLVSMKDTYYSGSRSGIYKLDNVTVPSVESVVGDRDFELIFKNSEELRYAYGKVENPVEDINRYTKYLIDECGYNIATVLNGYRVIKEDIEAKVIIVIDIKVHKAGYEIFARKGVN